INIINLYEDNAPRLEDVQKFIEGNFSNQDNLKKFASIFYNKYATKKHVIVEMIKQNFDRDNILMKLDELNIENQELFGALLIVPNFANEIWDIIYELEDDVIKKILNDC